MNNRLYDIEFVRDFVLCLDASSSYEFLLGLRESEHIALWNDVREIAALGVYPEFVRCAGGIWSVIVRMIEVRRYAEANGLWPTLDIVGKIDSMDNFFQDEEYSLPDLTVYVNPGPSGGAEDFVTMPAYSARGKLVQEWLGYLPPEAAQGIEVEELDLESTLLDDGFLEDLPVFIAFGDAKRRTRRHK